MKFIHLSDTHIGREKNHKKMKHVIKAIIKKKTMREIDFDTVVVTGDLTNSGFKCEYDEITSLLKRFEKVNIKVIAAPGNHDCGIGGIFDWEPAHQRFLDNFNNGKDYPTITYRDDGRVAFVILDSMQEEMVKIDCPGGQGYIGYKQLKQLKKILIDLNEKKEKGNLDKIIIILHHHPWDIGRYHTRILRDSSKFLATVQGQCDACLFGHKHSRKRLIKKEDKYNIPMIFAAGTTVSRRRNGKMRINVIDTTKNSIKKVYV